MCMWVYVHIKYLSENKVNLLKTERPIKLLSWYFIHIFIIFVWSNWFNDVLFMVETKKNEIRLFYYRSNVIFPHILFLTINNGELHTSKILPDHKSINDKKNMLQHGRKKVKKNPYGHLLVLAYRWEKRNVL